MTGWTHPAVGCFSTTVTNTTRYYISTNQQSGISNHQTHLWLVWKEPLINKHQTNIINLYWSHPNEETCRLMTFFWQTGRIPAAATELVSSCTTGYEFGLERDFWTAEISQPDTVSVQWLSVFCSFCAITRLYSRRSLKCEEQETPLCFLCGF